MIMKNELEALERLYCSGNLQLDYVLSNKHKQDYETVSQALSKKQESVLTKEEKSYILSLIDRDCESISKLEGAISDDGWIYEIYDIADSIREKLKEQKEKP